MRAPKSHFYSLERRLYLKNQQTKNPHGVEKSMKIAIQL